MNSVLVLLAAHNGKTWLKPQIDSILDQSIDGISLCIGDDCSTDSAIDELESANMNFRLHFIRFSTPSGGAGQSFMRLLDKSNLHDCDFVAFSDQDDVWNHDKLARAIDMLRTHQADGYSSAVTAFWPDGREKILGQNPNTTDLDFLFEGAGQGCTFVLRGEFARCLQQFVQKNRKLLSSIHYHDWLTYAVARSLQKRWIFDPVPSLRYRQHESNDTGARTAFSGIKKRIAQISNGWYADQVQQIITAVSSLDDADNAISKDFLVAWRRQQSCTRQLRLAFILFRRGRRRFSDRIVLTVSALFGWL